MGYSQMTVNDPKRTLIEKTVPGVPTKGSTAPSKTLRDGRTSKDSESAAGSALAQTMKKK